MTLNNALQKYSGESVDIYFHSTVVFSMYFNEVLDCINTQRDFKYFVFSTALFELENYKEFKMDSVTNNINRLCSHILCNDIMVSPYSEYDLTQYNRMVSYTTKKALVVYGIRKHFADFAVHCYSNDNIDVLLIDKVNGAYLPIAANLVKSNLLKYEYSAQWNDSPFSYSDNVKSGSVLFCGEKKMKFVLGDVISFMSGEGEVYKTSLRGMLCKVYKKKVLQRGLIDKLSYIVRCKKTIERVSWPEEIVYNQIGQPIGFLMRYAEGEPLSNLIYIWDGKDWLEKVCYAGMMIAQTVFLLHSQNIIVGDLSPKDILFDKRMRITIIDADSFQYGSYPCPGFMYEYKHKDIDPRLLKKRLRPFVFEYFSLAVIFYEMMTRGHFPNETKQDIDEISFGDDSSNDSMMFDYKNMQFPFSQSGHTSKATEASIRCWNNIPQPIQKLFIDVFTYKRVVSAAEWQMAFSAQLKKNRI